MDYHIFYVIAVTLVVTLHLQINPEATIGADCEEDGNCTDTETCNATKCECNSDSYESGDQCVSTHGGNCTDSSQCQEELSCYSTKCGCQNGTYYNGSQCVPKSVHGEECTDNSQCQDELRCYNQQCGCANGTVYNGSRCVSKSVHGEECTGNSQCQDELRCYNQKCGCANGTVYNGSRCISNSKLVPVITANTSTYNMFTVSWTRGDDSYGYTSTYDMKYNDEEMHNVNGSSSPQTTQSPTNLTSNTYYNVIIRRHIRYNGIEQAILESTPPYKIKTKSVHGEECTDNSQCQDKLTCYNQKCGCANGTVYNGSRCVSNSILVPVITDITSTYNMFTVTWTRRDDFYGYTSTYDMKYNDEVMHNVNGSSSPQTTQSPTDLTSNTYYNVSIRRRYNGNEQAILESTPPYSIKTKSSHKQTCTGNNDCAKFPDSSPGLICYTGGSSSVCLCPDNYYYKQALQCLQMSGLNPSFSLSSDLTSITVNLTNKPVAGSYLSTYSAQLNSGGVHNLSSTVTGIPGLKEGTVYSVTVTRTLTLKDVGRVQITSPPAQNYSTKVSYNSTCSSNGVCFDINTDCHGRKCLCNPTYYWRNVSCRPTSELRPQSVQADILNTTSVTVSWSPPNHSHFVSAYRLNATPTDSSVTVPPAVEVTGGGSSSRTLTGLQPGTEYRFSVESKSTNDGRVEYVPGNPVDKVTRPATIGKLDESNSNFSAPIMKVAFPTAKQKFLYYTVTLKGDDGYYQQVNASHHTDLYYYAEFGGITPGIYYNIQVLTISVQNSQSEPFKDRRRAMVAQAGEVVDLKNDTVTSRSVIINWKRPEKPNGKLFQYSLEILQDDACVSRIIFTCTECPRNESQFNDTAPSCQNLITTDISKHNITDEDYVVGHNITSLAPDTSYTIQAVAYNEDGRGKVGEALQIHTYSEPARKPKSVTITNITSNTVTVNWTPETPRPGNTSYIVQVHESVDDADSANFTLMNTFIVWGYANNSLDIRSLSSYWEYNFRVQSQTKDVPQASPFVNTTNIRTLESAPKQVERLEAQALKDVYDKIRFSWQCPPQKDGRNGVIHNATVKYETDTKRDGVSPKTGSETFPENGLCSWNIELEITPEFNYTFMVFISNSFDGETRVVTRYMPPGPAVIQDGSVRTQQEAVSEKENSLPLYIQPKLLRDGRNGFVESSGILVCKTNCQTKRRKRETKLKDYYEEFANWQKASKNDFIDLYRATPSTWLIEVKSTGQGTYYEIGKNSSCDKSDESGFCNGPLPAGTTFQVYVFVCTVAGCDESEPVSIQTKEPPSNIGVIVGAVCGVLAAVIIVIAVIAYLKLRKKSKPVEVEETANDEKELIQKKRPIVLSDFPEKVDQMHRDSNLLFSEEFEDICALSPKHNAVASETGSNKLKNRYVNILPFDHSRVKLRQLEDEDEESDYINANYIPGYRYVREYIATQGPMTGTINDFWRMIWEQKVPIIVMLSDLQEKGRPKVDRYYPENMEPVNYGDIRVEMTNFSPLSKYVIRIFKIELGDEVRTVRHYFLPGWQDFGANLTSDNVIDFIKSVRMEIKPNNTGPMCIHCSAGVGRTGTYVTLDVFQQHIDEEVMDKELDIFDFVMKMRQNRSYMVQTEKQYIFIHDTIKEMVIRKKKEIAERDKNIYMNSGGDDELYVNQAFETDPCDIYMNVDTGTDKPTTAL